MHHCELSGYVLEPLREDEEFILYRGRPRLAEAPPVLLLSPVLTRPAFETLDKIEHEYSFRSELDATWAVQPLALSQYNDQRVLVLENPGGEPLNRLIQGPMEMTQFLRCAIGLATALSQLHKRELIHKDVKPPNVLVDSATGQAWLTGFGIASRLSRERQSPVPPEFIAGTLPYMAPEQTGRMNRSIDSRSDLYALGITLYEMLTGGLPFSASDPMEWVHCHIARQPVPPSERLPGVPGSVSAIIMKLLAKTAEERYQTAAGAESDLRRCLAEWETQRRVEEFPPGEHDTPDRLLIPEKLYGRTSEIETLLTSFDRVVAGGRPELVLVSGYSGIGKSSVVNELHKPLVPPRGLFASGKFDQYKRDIPYATLAQAFQSLIRPLLSKSEEELNKWRDALHEALDPNGLLIVDLVPELELIIGVQPPVPELPPQDAQGRFQLVFRRFISVFARAEYPLALFLDDLQWLDAATLDVLEDLLTQPDVHHLMLIGAYRTNEVNSGHPLMRKLEAIRQAGGTVQEVVLAPLGREDLGQLITDSLHCEPERSCSLAQLIHDKTGGNPFFAIQFLSALSEEGLLTFDHGAARWCWDLTYIHVKYYIDNLVELMLKDQLYRENLALRDEVDRASMFEEIVGTSTALQGVLSRIAKVAPTDSTVLITGETGTGKELIARAVHKRSQRSGRAFVGVNCSALAPSLISSELFGHEKGAFTGATQRRLGRFELADGGTIFLDDVGELPPDTQVALLRVLQEREFERVGGAQSIQVDVRVIAATNRDLRAAMSRGTFRLDLFYRLNVFPIEVPALRERKDDIFMLLEYFVKRYASRAGKNIRSIDKKTLKLFQSYGWPGNIRELQNVVERSVIVCPGDIFSVDESWLSKESSRPASRVHASRPVEIDAPGEREIIEAALAESRGRVSGLSGAAAKLGIPRSTLESRIKALKIRKTRFKFG